MLHTTAMIIFCVIWTQEDHELFSYLNDCAKNSLRDKFPFICIGVAGMAMLHLALTLIYVGYFPHVWDLDPKRRCENDDSECNLELTSNKAEAAKNENDENNSFLGNKMDEENNQMT